MGCRRKPQQLERCKQAVLLCAGTAAQTFQTEIAEQQEVLGLIADMVINIYAAESALLRALKHVQGTNGTPEQLRLDLARGCCMVLPEQIERMGSTLLAATAEGDALSTQLAALRKLTRALPYNTIALKRRLASAALEAERYPLVRHSNQCNCSIDLSWRSFYALFSTQISCYFFLPQGFFAAQGLQGFFAAQGLHGFMRALAAQGLQGFFAAQGLHGLAAACFNIQGLAATALTKSFCTSSA